MNKDLLIAIDAVISDLKELSDTELQAKFEDNKNGIVGNAILDGREFLLSQVFDYLNLNADYTFSRKDIEEHTRQAKISGWEAFDRFISAANDNNYMMAA